MAPGVMPPATDTAAQSTSDAPKPAKKAPKPAKKAPKPAKKAPKPAKKAPKPAKKAPKPAKKARKPAKKAPKPAKKAPKPAKRAPKPAKKAPKSAKECPLSRKLLQVMGNQTRTRSRTAPQPYTAIDVLPHLVNSLSEEYPHGVAFLNEYRRVLAECTRPEAEFATEKIMETIEETLYEAAEGVAQGANSAVLATWLGAATVWGGPRVPGASDALRCLLQHLAPSRVTAAARALHAGLPPRDLIDASDTVRGTELGELLLRAALGKLLALEPEWRVEALTVGELLAALAGRAAALDGPTRLTTVGLAGRIIARGAAPAETVALLTALEPPFKNLQCTYYLRVFTRLKTLKRLWLPRNLALCPESKDFLRFSPTYES